MFLDCRLNAVRTISCSIDIEEEDDELAVEVLNSSNEDSLSSGWSSEDNTEPGISTRDFPLLIGIECFKNTSIRPERRDVSSMSVREVKNKKDKRQNVTKTG